jgi:hypothetical protein
MSTTGPQYTLSNLFAYCAALAQHKMIQSFYVGPLWELDTNDQLKYPLLAIVPKESTLFEHYIQMEMDFYVIDKNQRADGNRNNVLSDSYSTLLDFRNYIFTDISTYLVPDNQRGFKAEPLWEEFGNDCSGWKMEFVLKFDNAQDTYNIPGLSLSANTFSFNGTVYNLSLATYLPLTGGVLTGTISGPTADFTNYYSGGTQLTQIIQQIASGSTAISNLGPVLIRL